MRKNKQITRDEKAKIISGIIAIIIVGWIFFSIKSCLDDIENIPTDYALEKAPDVFEALVASQFFVEQRLKSPSTAKFGNSVRDTNQLNDSVFHVKSFVDSQNAFGAIIRIEYTCTIIFMGDSIACEDLIMKER